MKQKQWLVEREYAPLWSILGIVVVKILAVCWKQFKLFGGGVRLGHNKQHKSIVDVIERLYSNLGSLEAFLRTLICSKTNETKKLKQ